MDKILLGSPRLREQRVPLLPIETRDTLGGKVPGEIFKTLPPANRMAAQQVPKQLSKPLISVLFKEIITSIILIIIHQAETLLVLNIDEDQQTNGFSSYTESVIILILI
jgi:hypothetical protein